MTIEALIVLAVDACAAVFVGWLVLLHRGLIDRPELKRMSSWERARHSWR